MASSILESREAAIADPAIVSAIMDGVNGSVAMCGEEVRCVGVSAVPPISDRGTVTGMIGVHGNVSGFITVNMADKLAFSLVAGLLQEECGSMTHQVLDGVGEITNIVVGGVKTGLGKTPWRFSHVTVPTVILGQNYQIAYAMGLEYVSVTFEHQKTEAVMLADRLLQVAVSLIRL